MSYIIAGRAIKNEYLALGTLLTTITAGLGASSLSGSKKAAPVSDKPTSIVDTVKDTFKSDDEEAFIRDFIAKAEKEEAGAKH